MNTVAWPRTTNPVDANMKVLLRYADIGAPDELKAMVQHETRLQLGREFKYSGNSATQLMRSTIEQRIKE